MNSAQLLDLLTLALPYVEDCAESDAYKPAAVQALAARIRAAVEHNSWDYYEFTIGEHLAPAIINDDYTGLNDEEGQQLKDFLVDFKNGHWSTGDDSWGCSNCEVSGLYTKTTRMHFNFKQSDRG